jgi:hypothetical protein
MPAEARAIVQAAEAVGLEKDRPASGSAAELESILADNLVWLADPTFLATLFGRVREHLPQCVDGGDVAGINARFRIYRYVPGSTYRPHIDGAWPSSALGIDAEGKHSYIYDAEPELYSRLTFLLYLNDGKRMLDTWPLFIHPPTLIRRFSWRCDDLLFARQIRGWEAGRLPCTACDGRCAGLPARQVYARSWTFLSANEILVQATRGGLCYTKAPLYMLLQST